jgi:energy-coupling factor transport system ATP-binding protein
MVVIDAENLSFRYDSDEPPAVDSVDIAIEEGECVLICGPSGCGKTTLATCLTGIVPNLRRKGEMSGEVRIDGQPTVEFSKTELARRVDAVFEDPDTQIIGLSVKEDIAFGCENLEQDESEIQSKVAELLDRLGLAEYSRKDPRHLSGGEKQRLAVAAAVATEPDVLLMDEPVSQLDPAGSEVVVEMMRQQKARGTTMLLPGRKLGRAMQVVDRVVALRNGTVVADVGPREFLRDEELLADLGMWFPEIGARGRDAATEAAGETTYTLEVRDLWYSYASDGGPGTGAEWALRDVSLGIPEGEVVGLVGHNGSGKTTLSKHLNGLYTPNHGTILFRGRDVTGESTTELASEVGYVFQNPDTQLFTTTVRKEVGYGPRNLGYDDVDGRVEHALEQVDLDHLVDGRTSDLSRGEKQRVAIASVLALDPEVLVLDEPSSGIDYRTFWEIMSGLVENFLSSRRSLVLISHDANVVRHWADRVIEMSDGEKNRQATASEIPRHDHWGGDPTSPEELLATSPSTGERG